MLLEGMYWNGPLGMLKVWRNRVVGADGGSAGEEVVGRRKERVSMVQNFESTGKWGAQVLGGSKHSAQKRDMEN